MNFSIKKIGLLILFQLMLFSTTTFASHIAGGVITYQCLGNNQYRITFKFYRDCTGVNAPSPAQIEIYNSNNTLVQTLSLPLISTVPLPTNAPNPCTTPPTGICVEEITYTGNVTLPPIPGGYQLTFDLCCRNPGIVNGPAGSSAYSTWIPDVSKATCNNSAVYASAPPMFVCAGLPLNYDHSATDPDGDVLTYSLCTAIESAVPVTNYPYSAPYTATNPLGGGLTINPTTGLITGTPSTLGKFVVGVCVTETRNGVVINTTTRDFQWNVVDCQIATVASALGALTNCQTREVTFFNNSTGGVSYRWTFGDGQTFTTTSTTPLPHIYTSLGTYNVTLVSFATNPLCNDTVKSLVTVVDTCRPCGMNVSVGTTDGVCNPTSGCTQVRYQHPCSGTVSVSYGGSSTSSGCGGSSSSSGGTAPTTATVSVGGVTLPTAATTVTYTPLAPTTQATCPRSLSTSTSGGVVTITMNLWMNQPQTGGATTTITGGTAPYTINWTTTPGQTGPTASNVNPGTYTAIVTDANGCTEVKTFTVNGNSSLNFTANKTDATGCGLNNGTLSVTGVSGSTGTVTYSWSPGGWTTANVSNVPPGVYTVTVNDNAGCPKAATVTVGGVPTINVNAIVTNATCSYSTNGGATASASGGATPYTYSWNTTPVKTGATVTGLSKGFYTVIATDANGCTGSFSFTVTAPPALVLTMSKVDPSCFNGTNGTATVSASGGTGAKTYSWATSPVKTTATATGLSRGVYIVTVTDANGCTATNTITLVDPPVLVHDVVNTSTYNCPGGFTGSAQEVASGGTPPLTYSWTCTGATTPTVSGIPVGSCTVTTSDSRGCTARDVVVITDPGNMTVSASSTPTCGGSNDGTANVTPTGGIGPYTYSWSPGGATTQSINGLAAGSSYTVSVSTSGGCIATAAVTITSTPALAPTTVISGCGNNAAIDLTIGGGTAPFIYTWSNGPTTEDISGLSPATYTVTVWDVNNCYVTSAITVPVISCNPSVVANPITICNGSCGTITATGSVGAAPYTYAWAPATGLSATTGASVSACPTTTTTYTITITDNISATGSTSVIVTVNPNPVVSVPNATICEGTNTTLTASGGTTYTWTPAATLSASTGTSVVATPTVTTTYTVTGAFATGCTGVTTVVVTVNPKPSVTVAPATICEGNSTILNASGSTTYTWSPATGLNTTTGATVTADPLVTTTYTVVGSYATGCTASGTVVVTVIPPCGPNVNATGITLCEGSCGNITSTATGGVPPYTYLWSTGATATTADINVCPSVTTTYTITVTDNSAPVGSATAIAVVTVNPNPVVTVSGATICNGESTTLTASGATTYTWIPTATLSPSTGTSVVATPTVTTTYTVTGSNPTGCTGTTEVVVIVNPVPVVSVPNASICPGGSTILNATGATTYTWSPGTDLSATTGASVTANPPATATYTVCGTTNGCSSCTTVTVTVGALVADAGNDVTICYGANTTLNASGGTIFTWTPTTALTDPSISNPIANPTVTTTYTVTVSDGFCSDDDEVVVIVNPNITLNVAPIDVTCFNACNGQIIVIPSGGNGSYTYNWSSGCVSAACNNICAGTYSLTVTDGLGCTATGFTTVAEPVALAVANSNTNVSCFGVCDGTADVTATGGTLPYNYAWTPSGGAGANANNLCAGTYTCTVTDANGCTINTVVTITQPTNVVITSTDASICPNECTTLNTTCLGGTSPYSYSWNPGGLTGASVSVCPAATTVYTVVSTDANGCTGGTSVTVTVNPTPIIVVPAATICEKTSTTLTASGANTYTWSPLTGLSSGSGTTVTASPTTTTPYVVIGTSTFGCTGSITVVVTVDPAPTMTATNANICPAQDTTLTVSGNSVSYIWSPAGSLNSSTGAMVTARPTTTTTYTITGTGPNGCTSTITTIVSVNPKPNANFSTYPEPVDIFDPTIYFTDKSTGGTIISWNWNFGDPKPTTSTIKNPTFKYPDSIAYYNVQLIVVNQFGCIDTIVSSVYVKGIFTFYIPNTFTPNGDDTNDKFMPKGTGIDETDYDLWIFDRWGNLIWHTDVWGEAWDGRANGGSEIAQMDTYVWKVHVREKDTAIKHDYIGHVNIVK